MEYLVLAASLALFFIVIFVREGIQAKKREKRFIRKLYEDYGKLPEREYTPERYARIDKYYKRHPQVGQIDDITWNDLEMDAVFQRMNYTFSAIGEEYLYHTLRSAGKSREELLHLEEVAGWFHTHGDERVKVQYLMHGLGHTGKYSLYDYLDHLDVLGERSNRKDYLVNGLYLPCLALLFFQTGIGILGIVALMIYQIVTYFKEKNTIEPYITSFAYVKRLILACGDLGKVQVPVCKAEWKLLEEHGRKLRGMQRGSYWVFSANQSKTTGNPLDILMDYVRMIFHVDLMIFNNMLFQLKKHLPDVDVLMEQVGFVETAISVGAFRASLENGYCIPSLETEEGKREKTPLLEVRDVYHPLLTAPVKNSIAVSRGVLLTGSNASGKSTFLKAVAVNAILAQTIHTCTAGEYRGPLFDIYSSMALRDDMAGGDSYYIVEIKSLKRILDAPRGAQRQVLCFVDEVLRGTNTVDRIAASTQILKSLCGKGVLCFAATHDIELTELLKKDYDNYHFEEEVREGDIFFPYKLLPGPASTRNAIRLLEIMGYEEKIITRATSAAEDFLRTGVWKMSPG